MRLRRALLTAITTLLLSTTAACAFGPPLEATIVRNPEAGTLQQKLDARFPLGAPTVDLVRFLESQGFRGPKANRKLSPVMGAAYLSYGIPMCKWVDNVRWESDPEGKLTLLEATGFPDCI